MDLLNIYIVVQEFYAIEAIAAMLSVNQGSNFEPMRHSHSRWYRDFNEFRDEYIIKFASAIFDYTVSVVAAELRHCKNQASQYIEGYYTDGLSRDEVYKDCFIYNTHDILKAGLRMFDTDRVNWRRSFGGDKWKQIAKAGLMKGKVSDCVFIDHCVDLSHNCSIYFDKRAGIFNLLNLKEYQSLLDLKRTCEPQVLISTKQGFRFNQLVWRANNLNIIEVRAVDDALLSAHNEAESLLFNYRPIVWGTERLDYSECKIITKEYFDGDRRREYSREDGREYNREDGRENDHEDDSQDDCKYARAA